MTIDNLSYVRLREREKRASPGIEPGPPAPKAGILPLNYKAFLTTTNLCTTVPDFLYFILIIYFLSLFSSFWFYITIYNSPFKKRGLWRESNPRHLHPKQVFYHLTTKPFYLLSSFLTSFLFHLLVHLSSSFKT